MLHIDVPLEVLNFLYIHHDSFPVKIITGKSDKMRNIVVDILNKNDYYFDIPAHNPGEIIVYH
jgi:hypothetical protein